MAAGGYKANTKAAWGQETISVGKIVQGFMGHVKASVILPEALKKPLKDFMKECACVCVHVLEEICVCVSA